jgi:hypothetical protein
MNPWKIIGWIVLGCMVLVGGCCGLGIFGAAVRDVDQPETRSAPDSKPKPSGLAYAVHVVKLECSSRGIDRAQVTIENRGDEIPFAKVFVEFVNRDGSIAAAEDSFFSPSTIPRGARASATAYSRDTRAKSCRVTGIQDGDGNRVTLM